MSLSLPANPLAAVPPRAVVGPSSAGAAAEAAPAGRWITGLETDVEPMVDEIARVLGDEALAKLGFYRLPAGFLLSVVMPVYNEVRTLAEIVARVRASGLPLELVIVDDGSTDGTRDVLATLAAAPDIRVVLHERNQGKGAALRTGLAHARGDVVLIQDADLEYDPSDYARLLEPILRDEADVVYGSRYLGAAPRRQGWPHRLANYLLTGLSNRFTGLRLTDMETCYKVFRRARAELLVIRENRFGVEPELTARLARQRCRFVEVPVSYAARNRAEGKKIRLKDALRAVYAIVRYGLAD